MTTIGHIESLERKHQQTDREIQTLVSDRADSLEISAAKRRKLRFKDELTKAKADGGHQSH